MLTILSLVDWLFRAYEFLLLATVILSWVRPPRSELIVWLERITEPVLAPCRELINAVLGLFRVDARSLPLDFSPIVALLIIEFIRKLFFTVVIRLMT